MARRCWVVIEGMQGRKRFMKTAVLFRLNIKLVLTNEGLVPVPGNAREDSGPCCVLAVMFMKMDLQILGSPSSEPHVRQMDASVCRHTPI